MIQCSALGRPPQAVTLQGGSRGRLRARVWRSHVRRRARTSAHVLRALASRSAVRHIAPTNPWLPLLTPHQLVEISSAFRKFGAPPAHARRRAA